jgi:hypothetical protein
MDPGQWWVLEEVGCSLQMDDPPYRSGTEQRTWSSGTWNGQFSIKNPERADGQEEMTDGPRMQQRNKEPRPQRTITSEKQEDIRQDLQEGPRAGDGEAKSRIFTEIKCHNIVVGLVPSETKEYTAHRVAAINVGALNTLGTFGCTNRREMMVMNLDQQAPN